MLRRYILFLILFAGCAGLSVNAQTYQLPKGKKFQKVKLI